MIQVVHYVIQNNEMNEKLLNILFGKMVENEIYNFNEDKNI